MEDNIEELVSAFEKYKKFRLTLKELLIAVNSAYAGLDQLIPKDPERTTLNIQSLLLSPDEESNVTRTFQDPKLMFVGQTNAGKSSLINEILGVTVVKADDVPCTARIVELTYGDNKHPIVEIIDKNEEVIDTKELDTMYIPSGVANLPEDDRDKPECIGSRVHAKINVPFLKSGVKVVDTPGKNEYKGLDKLVEEHMESVLPLIVYVIDGRNMLSKQDVDDITELYRNVPQGNVFFVVTKCDDPDLMEGDDDSDDDSDDEKQDRSKPSKLEEEIKQGIYDKLVELNFLKRKPLAECKNYHALSSRYIKKYRWSLKEPRTDAKRRTLKDCQRFMDDFKRFKARLVEFTSQQLIQTVVNAAKTLQLSLSKCLDYFINATNAIFNEKSENEKNIKQVEIEEFLLSQLLQQLIMEAKNEFQGTIAQVVRENREKIIQMAERFKFVQFQVPSDGYIQNRAVDQYKTELREYVMTCVGDLIHREVMSKCSALDDVFKNVSTKVKDIQEKLKDEVQFHDALQEMFVSQYKFDIKKAKLTRPFWKSVMKVLRKALNLISLRPVWDAIKGVNVMDKSWRVGVSSEVVDIISPADVAEVIVTGLCHHIARGHESFVAKLADVRKLYQKSYELGDCDRKLIRSMAPLIARLDIMAWNIIDTQFYGTINYGKIRGKGAQGIVLDCDARGPNGELCVAKLIKLESESEMGDMGLEIHYSRKLKHPNIARIYGTMYTKSGEHIYELSIIMPRMERDLLQALPNITSLKQRLQVALQVGQALDYIHGLGMMHRDVKCANVLLDAQNRVQITDFGLCKPPGLSDGSFVGTPVHMAPEIIEQKKYDEKVDVFAFGILLWYICEGKGNHPKYVFGHSAIQGLLLETAIGRRPERVSGMRDDCWELMESCWRKEPIMRPTMTHVLSDLNSIIVQL